MEAGNVLQNKSCSALLNKMLPLDLRAFNIGVSGHFFPVCTARLSAALSEFEPRKYVIIETSQVDFDIDLLRKLAYGEYQAPSDMYYQGFFSFYRRLPVIRTLAGRIKELRKSVRTDVTTTVKNIQDSKEDSELEYYSLLEQWLKRTSDTAREYEVRLIILFHPQGFTFSSEKTLSAYQTDVTKLELFSQACSVNGITFIDMTSDFEKHYWETYEPAYGFLNTRPGWGHLNKVGHRLIADRLYKEIMKLEGAK